MWFNAKKIIQNTQKIKITDSTMSGLPSLEIANIAQKQVAESWLFNLFNQYGI